MRPDDLSLVIVPSDPQIHPDGVRVAFVITRIDLEADGYRRRIHQHDGSVEFAFTAGPVDSMPRWSPDGSRLAFLRATDLAKAIPQLAVMPAAGGESTVISEFPLGVEYFAWSPGGEWICAVAKSWDPDLADLSEEERSRRPKRITRFPYRFDQRGWLHDRYRQLWLIDLKGDAPPRRLTTGALDESMPAWHPDGSRVALVTDRHPRRGLEPGADVIEVTLEGEVSVPVARGGWLAPIYSPQGDLHLVGHPENDYPRLNELWRVGEGGDLTKAHPDLDRSIFSIAGGGVILPRWVDGALFTVVEDSGRIEVFRVVGAGQAEAVLGGERVVTGFDVSASGRVAATVSTTELPGELIHIDEGIEEPLTSLEKGERPSTRSTDYWRITEHGAEIDVWVVIPEGEGPFPVLLNIHGGPASQYGFGFFDEAQVYAGAGYAVVMCNPRGSSGRGLEFLRAVTGDGWGRVDLTDVSAALVSALSRHPALDANRIGIMGGSYGGFMTAWTTGHDQRYRSAVVERALISFPSFSGTSDIGPHFGPNYLGTTELVPTWEKSPLSVAANIRTPTLILHSEDDYRCPIEQAEQLLLALLLNGIEAEMVRFPGEGHELSRSGKPRHRVERFAAILAWHDRHLRGS